MLAGATTAALLARIHVSGGTPGSPSSQPSCGSQPPQKNKHTQTHTVPVPCPPTPTTNTQAVRDSSEEANRARGRTAAEALQDLLSAPQVSLFLRAESEGEGLLSMGQGTAVCAKGKCLWHCWGVWTDMVRQWNVCVCGGGGGQHWGCWGMAFSDCWLSCVEQTCGGPGKGGCTAAPQSKLSAAAVAAAVTAVLLQVGQIVEALVLKYVALTHEELEEWRDDPEGYIRCVSWFFWVRALGFRDFWVWQVRGSGGVEAQGW